MPNPFPGKVRKTRKLIEKALAKHDKPIVACSFGKNSMVVLHLVRQYKPDVHVVFNDTLVEYPESYEFKDRMKAEWRLNLIETKPIKDFWWVVSKYGFPMFSRKGHKDATKSCPRYLKEYPLQRVLRKEKFDLYFTGLSRHESRLREFSARRYGPYFYSKRNKHWKCHPVLDWTETDIWDYHESYKVPHNPIYDKATPDGFKLRTACWCCTIPIRYGKIGFLRMHYPDLWRKLLDAGLGQIIARQKLGKDPSHRKLKRLMRTDPEFFDRI